jgi:CRISPR-associated protein Cmr5
MTEQTRPIQQTREQERAAQAWKNVAEDIGNRTEEDRQRYGALVRRLPTLVQVNGLGQTAAFLLAKAKGNSNAPEALLYSHISEWTLSQMSEQGSQDLMSWIREQDSDAYRRATTEILAYALWLRRFVEAQGWGESEEEDL